MFEETIIQELKQNNISTDGEKTMQRTEELWKGASKENKETIERLAGVARSTVQRVYKTGSISAKLVVSIAQTLDVDPRYLTGEVDERGNCSDDMLREFLIAKGYKKLIDETKKGSKKRRKDKEIPVSNDVSIQPAQSLPDNNTGDGDDAEKETTSESIVNQEIEVSSNTKAFMDNMTEDEMILLMRSIMLRAKAGIGCAVEQAEKLKTLLLS